MRNVSYKRVITTPSAAADEITNRAKRQSRIYTVAFIILGITVLLYIMYALSVTKYDGFMVSRNVNIRHIDNITIVDYFVEPGDYVEEGDTLYSFVNVDWLSHAINPYSRADFKSHSIEIRARYNRLLSEYVKQKKTMDSLEFVVERVREDVEYGVATKEYAEEKEWELFVCNIDLENTSRLLNVELMALKETEDVDGGVQSGLSAISNYSYSQRRDSTAVHFGEAYSYRVAYVDMAIINLPARHGMLILSGEPTLTYMPYNNPEMLDLHAKMLLTSDQFSKIDRGEIYNAYAGKDFLGKVRTTFSSTYINDGLSTEDQGRYVYKFNDREIVVRTEFLDTETVYHKYQVDKQPIVFMKYKWGLLDRLMNKMHISQQHDNEIKEINEQRIRYKSKKRNNELQ